MVSAHKHELFSDGGSPAGVAPADARPHASPATSGIGAVIEALDGRPLTRGTAELLELAAGWTARLSQLDRPGVIASVFFAERARDVVLRLDDGRSAKARISGTSFIAASERVCDLAGIEAFA